MKKYIDTNTELRTHATNKFQKEFFKLMNNCFFGKTMENVRNHRDIKLIVTNARRKKLVSETNYHSSKQFSENLMAIEMRKTRVVMNKPIYLGQVILDLRKTLMYEFWYDYIKPKSSDRLKLCYMDTDSFIVHIETEDFYKDIAKDVNKRFDTSGYDKKDNRPLPIAINKKDIGMFKDELNGKIMEEFVALRAKTYAFLWEEIDDVKVKKKAKGTKKCVVKRNLTFENYRKALFNNIQVLRLQRRFKSDCHNLHTEKVNKIVLSCNDDKRVQTFDGITTYPYGTNEMLAREKEIPIPLYY